MSIDQLAKASPTILGWLTAVIGWITAFLQWRKKRKSDAELKLIRRRGDAPYLTPSKKFFKRLFIGASEDEARYAGTDTVLCATLEEVPKDTPAGTLIRLVVENEGESARGFSVCLDGQPIQLRNEPKLKFASGLTYLEYSYDPPKHGQIQQLKIKFETISGVQDCHTYTTKHGVRFLARQDPP